MTHPVFPSVLRDKTRELLHEYIKYKSNTYIKIAKATGLSETWIAMFARNELKHTDVGRIEALHNYLSTEPLKV